MVGLGIQSLYKRGRLWGERSQFSSPPAKALDMWRKPSRIVWSSHHLAEDLWKTYTRLSFPGRTLLHCQCRRCRRRGFKPRVEKIPWRRKWQSIWRKCQLQYCLENSVDRRALQSTVHESQKAGYSWATEHARLAELPSQAPELCDRKWL